MLLGQTFGKLMRTPSFTKNIAGIVVDEAHCVSQWGLDFRKDFAELDKLRSYVALDVPFLATSATMTPHVLGDVQLKLGFSMEKTYLVNLGNDRHNITPLVSVMKGAASDLSALDFTVDEAHNGEELLGTIIYARTREITQQACEHLRNQVPERYRDQIDFIHALRSPRAKRSIMQRFREGHIKILIATEVAGMVCLTLLSLIYSFLTCVQGLDIHKLVRIVQYMVPGSLSEWIQHYGRAGRDGTPAVVILLVEPSVFERVKKRSKRKTKATRSNAAGKRGKEKLPSQEDPAYAARKRTALTLSSEDEGNIDHEDDRQTNSAGPSSDEGGLHEDAHDDDGTHYKKILEQGMRDWIEGKKCRRAVSDAYFNNPPRQKGYIPSTLVT